MNITLERLHAMLLGIEKKIEEKTIDIEKSVRRVRFSNSSNTLTITNAARYLGCSRSTIYNRINDGTIVTVTKGTKDVIPLSELESLFNQSI